MALSGNFFNATYYLNQNSDVAANWVGSALSHYEHHGANEGRAPNSWFDYQYYRTNNTDLQDMNALQLFEHYEAYGYAEGRSPDSTYANFDEAQYLADYSDLGTGGITEATALNHYLMYGSNENRTAKNDDGTTITPPTTGTTYTLTTAADDFTGTADDDTFTANVIVNPATGLAQIETLTSLDSLDGGAGTDVLNYTTVGGSALPTGATIKNIETINLISDGAATIDTSGSTITGVTTLSAKAVTADATITTNGDVTSVTITGASETVAITDSATTDVITTVSITGAGATAGDNSKTVTSTALTSYTLADITGTENDDDADDLVTNTTSALTVNLSNVSIGAADLLAATATSATVVTSGTSAIVIDDVDFSVATGTVNWTSGATHTNGTTIDGLDIAAATQLTVTGAGKLTLTDGTYTALTTIDATGSTGGLVMTAALAVDDTFTGGSGADGVTLAAHTKATAMGAGDDTVTFTAAALGTGGSVDAGDGTGDILKTTAALAANDSMTANSTFAGTVSGFEVLELTTTGVTKTINMSNLDNLSKVRVAAGATAITIDNFANAGTVELLGASTAVVANVLNASVGGNNSDSITVNTTSATSGANIDFGAFTAAGVETVTVDTSRTGTAVTADENQLDLTLANVVTLNITGNVLADLDGAALTAASLQTVDGSTNTGGIKVTVAGATQGVSLTGSATKANSLTGGDGGDTITGGSGVDTIVTGTGADTVSAGAGDDSITFTQEIANGDTLTGGDGADTFTMATTTATTVTANTITDINLGTSTTAIDKIQASITAIEGMTTVTDMVDTSANSAANTDGTVVKLGTDGATIADADLVVIDTATFSNTTTMLAGLKTAGSATITYGAALTDNDAFLIAYSDGTDAYIAVATAGAANLTTSEGVDSVENIIKLTGVNLAGLANIDSLDYTTIT